MGDRLYCVEYAASGRSTCRLCETLIENKSMRVGQRVQGMKHDGIETIWFHYDCWIPSQLQNVGGPVIRSPMDFENFDNIRWDDQQQLIHLWEAGMDPDPDENFHGGEPSMKKMKYDFEEREMEKQNKMIFAMKDELEKVSAGTFRSLLEIVSGCDDKQLSKRTEANLCLVADAMVFGLLEPCAKCSGRFEYVSGYGYRCTGNFTEWTRCEEITQDPPRVKFVLPKILRDSAPFLHSYTPQVRKRLVRVTAPSISRLELNANLNTSVRSNVNIIFSKEIMDMFKKSGIQTLRVTRSGTVDPDSNLADVAHVYECDGVSYTATLAKTCTQTKKNSHYKLQVLKHNQLDQYWLFRGWGRIGTEIGDNRCEPLPLETCIGKFEKCYFKETGNKWSDREKFVKNIGKMYPVDTDHGEEFCRKADAAIHLASKLVRAVQDLMKLIFNVDTMKRVMMSYDLDLDKMPLGNLSMDQLLKAYSALTILSNEMRSTLPDGDHALKLTDATNKFYTLIPHSFGLLNPPPFKTQEDIKAKCDMISDLIQIQCAFNLSILGINSDEPINSLDVMYDKLRTDIAVLDKRSKIYNVIERYIRASTYWDQDLEIEEVFVVKRTGEAERFKSLPNRMLLWHGSRTVNFPGILSHGLRVPPHEAPATGYMFGKGIYFADRFEKSAKYCRANSNDPTGLMLLCEVALGNMYERKHAEDITQLPEGKDSTMGLGMQRPDPTQSLVTRDGVEVPCGRTILAKSDEDLWSLNFNEYVVYNPAQVKARYLVKFRDLSHLST